MHEYSDGDTSKLEEYSIPQCLETHLTADELKDGTPLEDIISLGGDRNSEPYVGMQFTSADEAHEYYNDYARRVGFGTCIKTSWRSRTDRSLILIIYACSKHGFKKVSENTRNPRPNVKTNCKAAIKVKRVDAGKWVVILVSNEHNHELTPKDVHLMRSHKRMESISNYKSIMHTSVSSISGTLSMSDKLDGLGGRSSLRKRRFKGRHLADEIQKELLGDEDAYVANGHLQTRKQLFEEGEAQAVSEYFIHIQCLDPTFFYAVDLDKDERPRCLFWIDGKSRTRYSHFGDVIIFDSTYIVNKYRMPLTSFIGVNHHGQAVLFGCALLREETAATYVWLFQTWLGAMCGQPPVAILTDHNKPIRDAICEVFPESGHRFCIWHVLQKMPLYLGWNSRVNPNFMAELKICIYRSLEINEFELKWQNLMQKYGLVEDEWMTSLFEDRRQWVPVYINDTLFAGMTSSPRIETMKSFFDSYVSKDSSLRQFLNQYELVLESKIEKEAQADDNTIHVSPVLQTTSPFESQLARIYTREIFKLFQVEITGIPGCFTVSSHQEEDNIVYIVSDSEVKMDFKVCWNHTETRASCQCRTWEFHGFLCRHAMMVLLMSGVHEIPPHYILKRWTIEGRSRVTSSVASQGDCPKTRLERFNALCHKITKVAEEGSLSDECYDAAIGALHEAMGRVAERLTICKGYI